VSSQRLFGILIFAVVALAAVPRESWGAELVVGQDYHSVQLLSGTSAAVLQDSLALVANQPYARIDKRGAGYALRVGYWDTRAEAVQAAKALLPKFHGAHARIATYRPDAIVASAGEQPTRESALLPSTPEVPTPSVASAAKPSLKAPVPIPSTPEVSPLRTAPEQSQAQGPDMRRGSQPVVGQDYYSVQLLSGTSAAVLQDSLALVADQPYARIEKHGAEYALRVGYWESRAEAVQTAKALLPKFRGAHTRIAPYQPDAIVAGAGEQPPIASVPLPSTGAQAPRATTREATVQAGAPSQAEREAAKLAAERAEAEAAKLAAERAEAERRAEAAAQERIAAEERALKEASVRQQAEAQAEAAARERAAAEREATAQAVLREKAEVEALRLAESRRDAERRPTPEVTPLRTEPAQSQAQAPALSREPQQSKSEAAKPVEYQLGAGDTIKIVVFQNPDLTVEARVTENGTISFPLIGEVKVGGLTIPAAEQTIAKALKDGGFIQQPQVNIVLGQIRGYQVAVLGQVNRPGRFPLETTNIHVSEMIAIAGGITAATGADTAVLTGIREGRPFRKEIDIAGLFADKNRLQDDAVVQGGDVIFVQRAPLFYIYGEVQRPGSYRVERNMTVRQALAQGGGLTIRGTERWLRLHRRGADGKVEILRPGFNDPVQPEDVIYVRESIF